MVVYDILAVPTPFPWGTLALVLLTLGFGVGLYVYTVVTEDPTYQKHKGLAGLILGSVIVSLTASECSVQSQLKECHAWRNNGQYQITEGIIQQFQEDPSKSHKWERFAIGSQTFTVSRGAPPCHFQQTKYWGGPFDAGKKVRIYHQGEMILKIEML